MATMAPMLAQGGLAEILKGGAYLNPNPTEYELQEGGKALAQITVLAQLFQSLVSGYLYLVYIFLKVSLYNFS
jgi:hypothetical protein